MRPLPFIFALILVSGCASTQHNQNDNSAESIAEAHTCEQIEKQIDAMEDIITSASPSQTEKIVQDTAIQTAQTGVQVSGILGSAGVFAGIGMNFLHRLYNANASTRQQEMKDIAVGRQGILIDAYYIKQCEGNASIGYGDW